ncbi:Aste57867_23424 [Aphanomyces stellatus]|uniref:Aste57867_23424 protein n=1 Tax=Aphanomyces stellatus TaxID=120398 RepID=A0A485LPJ0_9STRA|nr:hypothetical protein As57867_023353 [Aphanomyces stellatus]VFU00070.1 Aste57867_23424 [Aphanomyces stellatus]
MTLNDTHDNCHVAPDSNMELVHVLAVFRHGDRAPIKSVVAPNLAMSEAETKFWAARVATEARRQHMDDIVRVQSTDGPIKPGGVWPNGHLTEVGVEAMTERGRAMRRRYADFLTDCRPQQHVFVCSTNYRRTVLTAQSVVHGLFPDDATTEKPMVLHIKHLAPSHTPEHHTRGLELAKLRAVKTLPHYPPLEVTVKTILGLSPNDDVNWNDRTYAVREVLDCRRAHGLAFPDGLTDEIYDAIVKHSAWEMFTFYELGGIGQEGFSDAMHQINALIHEGLMRAPQRRMTLVSAHDTTVIGLLCALQLEQVSGSVGPPYGSMLVFDIYQDKTDGSYHFVVSWDGKTLRFPSQPTTLAPISFLNTALTTCKRFHWHEEGHTVTTN